MSGGVTGSHAQLAAALRVRVEETGTLERSLREGILARGAGGAPIAEPYESLVHQIADDSYRVTDAHVRSVLAAAGSEADAFEVILTASIGAGLRRWDAAARAIEEADHATS
jgi:hypothetical protein